ncbi:MAG: hypothetical protein WCX88_04155 [Patescibacteria group bacterium]
MKTKFKHGQKVECSIGGVTIKDAKISIDESGTPYICQDYKHGSDTENKLGYKYSWELDEDFNDCNLDYLRPMITIEERRKKAERLLKRAGILK